MHTKDMLADALHNVGLEEMAAMARTGYYHDYLSPLDLPEFALVTALNAAAIAQPDNADAIEKLRQRVINGDFDANAEESDAWADSPEGQAAFRSLTKDKP